MLIQETDAGEDWRVDPVLREACQPVVDAECSNVRGGDARFDPCCLKYVLKMQHHIFQGDHLSDVEDRHQAHARCL
jgi:Cysteine rich repeat